MDKSKSLLIGEEEFIFDCRRVIYWPRRKILMAADLHWGKTQYLRNHGIAVSDAVLDADLDRLGHVLEDYEVKSFIVLGDLIHHEAALSPAIISKIQNFREKYPVELVLVKGNHDRFTTFPPSWGIVEELSLNVDQFLLVHDRKTREKKYQFCGHVHPMMRLQSSVDSLRLPSFMLLDKACYLPAYSHLTGGKDMKLLKGEKALVLMPDGIELFER
ncbi:MAG: ligase-associated DNA damage response endonuclease PdeM [Bdellovibrionota bacterium]